MKPISLTGDEFQELSGDGGITDQESLLKTDVILNDQADIQNPTKSRYVFRSKRQVEYIQPMQKGFGTLESIPYESLPMLRRNGLREMTLNPHENPSEVINRYNAKSIQDAIYNEVPAIQQYTQNDYNFPSRSHNFHESYTNIHPQIHRKYTPINRNGTESEEFMKFLNRTLTYSPLKIFKEFIVSLNNKLSACCEKCRVDIFQVFENSSEFSVPQVTTEPPINKDKFDVLELLQQLYEARKTSTTSTTPVPKTTSTTTMSPSMISKEHLKPVLVDFLQHIYAFSKAANSVESLGEDYEIEETTISPPIKILSIKKK